MLTCRHKSCLSAASNNFFHCSMSVRYLSSAAAMEIAESTSPFSWFPLRGDLNFFLYTYLFKAINRSYTHCCSRDAWKTTFSPRARETKDTRSTKNTLRTWGTRRTLQHKNNIIYINKENSVFMALDISHLFCSTAVPTAFQGSQCSVSASSSMEEGVIKL